TEEYAPEPEYEETEASSGLGQQIADYAVQFVGNPYAWGGTSLTNGADCSGFVQSVFANFGIGLARTAESQAYGGSSVSLDQLQPGDLLFYNSTGSIDHVAIYIGGSQIVHAANSSSGIIISSAYYSTPVCASRYW
ncbi:MAG: C40 family peptidase, partial [Lachnospiraceae bacterium]|nr:C40 family peptidase [Lachnospiraceae bacterium]